MKKRNRESGFSLIMVAVTGAVMIAMMGLAIDLGRMFIVKNELQTFADAAAVAAANQLDGTALGVAAANPVATSGPQGQTLPNAYNFAGTAVGNVTVTYGTSFSGSYDSYATAASASPNSYRFLQVSASEAIPLYFLPLIQGIPQQVTLTATAIAGAQPSSSIGDGGLLPFSPDAHNPADTKNFGFTPGVSYTLKWGNGNSTNCAGDAGFSPGSAPSAHGFVDLGQGNGNSSLRSAIEYGGYPNANSSPSSVAAGSWLSSVPGNRGASIFSAMSTRSGQDPDQTSLTWAEYRAAATGNMRRVITVAVNDVSRATGNGSNYSYPVIGFANFLLSPSDDISGSSGPICATYIGPGSLTGGSSGGTDGTVIYSVNLYK